MAIPRYASHGAGGSQSYGLRVGGKKNGIESARAGNKRVDERDLRKGRCGEALGDECGGP